MATITVRLESPSTWYGRAVSLFTRSPYSHTSLQVGASVYAAQYGSGVTKELAVFMPAPAVACPIEVTDDQATQLAAFLQAQVGKRYDIKAILQFLALVRLVAGDDPHTIQAARKARGRWFCSELTFAALLKVGVTPLIRIEAWQVSPAMLALSPILQSA